MSSISNSFIVDIELYNRNPSTRSQDVEEVPPFFQNFPSCFLDENQLFSVLAADQTQQANLGLISNMPLPRVNIINMNTAQEIPTNTPTAGTLHQHHSRPNDISNSTEIKKSSFSKGASTARRSGKKDRHTKINTAKGLRDRRIRLSLQIARQFFDLQDMLGFDKASKTIDWLFSKSKKAIKQLRCSASQHLEENGKVITEASEGEFVSGMKNPQKSVTRSTKHIAKELRGKARARARERTREKMMIRCLEKSKCNFPDQANNLAQLGPAGNPNSLFQICQESMSNSSSSQDNISTSQSSLHLTNMELLGATTASSSGSASCSMYGYHEKYGDLFLGGLESYPNNLCFLGWDINSVYSNPNSINFLENTSYNFQN